MRFLITVSVLATSVALGGTVALKAELAHNPANTISTLVDHPDSFRHFAPELPQMRARVSQINTDFGLHVSEIEPGLFFVTDQVYQSAFLVTDAGVVVFDAPPSFGTRLRKAIEMTAPGAPITHYLMTHAHSDHNGGGHTFGNIDGLQVIAAAENAHTLEKAPLRGVLTPTRTFANTLDLTIGGVPISLRTAGFHAEDTDVIIHLPDQNFLMAVDTITPGEVPFMNFGATSDIQAYLEGFDTFLSYEFEHFLSGHVSVLGTREDVILNRDYAYDVRDTVYGLMPGFGERVGAAMALVDYQNSNLAYRMAMEGIRDDCTSQIIERWSDQLSVTDLWADSHCETMLVHAVMH